MTDRASHRAAVEAGYADLTSYVAKYREPEYPGASIRTARLVGAGERGEVRLMDYGSNSKKRYRVAAFCPGNVIELPGDTPKVEPEADNWCASLNGANAWFDLYVDRAHRDGWKDAAEKPEFRVGVQGPRGVDGPRGIPSAQNGVPGARGVERTVSASRRANKARDEAFEKFDKSGQSNAPEFDPGAAQRAFNAGWNARKHAEYETALNVKRPLHSSAYEPLTPFKSP